MLPAEIQDRPVTRRRICGEVSVMRFAVAAALLPQTKRLRFSHATAVAVTRRSPRLTKPCRPRRALLRSGRRHRVQIHRHPDLAAQEIEQYGDPFIVRHTFEQAETSRKYAFDHPNLFSARKTERCELYETFVVFAPC